MAEWGGLENRCTCERTEGSNPSLSAKLIQEPLIPVLICRSESEKTHRVRQIRTIADLELAAAPQSGARYREHTAANLSL